MANFVNMDRKFIRNGGRTSIPMSKKELSKKIEHFFVKHGEEYDEEYIYSFLIEEHSKIRKDLSKVNFNTENVTFKDGEFSYKLPKIVGFHTLENGFTFLGGLAGGDWEYPLFFIIYWDSKSLRGYIPTYGNAFNVDFKSAFGSEMESNDAENIFNKKYKKEQEKLIEEYKRENPKIRDFSSLNFLIDIYANRYGVSDSLNIDINEDAIIEDVINRIILK